MPTRTVEDRFAQIAERLGRRRGVSLGSGKRGFGSDALTVNGRIFAIVTRGRLVLKLPQERVSALIDRGDGLPFDAGKGTPMKGWVVLTDQSSRRWLPLATEACQFVGGSAGATVRDVNEAPGACPRGPLGSAAPSGEGAGRDLGSRRRSARTARRASGWTDPDPSR
jgi:hypothetical protein